MKGKKIDTLLINGRIYTMREEGEWVEAIGIHEGRIVFAGSTTACAACPAERIIDLKGKTVLPGFGDSHLHLSAYCQNRETVGLEEAKSMEEMIRLMKVRAAATNEGEWVKGTGFDQTKFSENRMPTRWDLDRISTDHPIVIRRCCLHVMVANSLAIQMAGIGQEELDKYKGLIETEGGEDGFVPNGIFREGATAIFDAIVPDPLADPVKRRRNMKETFYEMVSLGLTSVHTYAAKIWNYEEAPETYLELEETGDLPLRVVVSLDELFEPEEKPVKKDPYNKVRMGSYKLFTDGSLGARSAALTKSYHDDPGNCGISIDREKLEARLRKAFQRGLQPAIHAIGDKALDITIEAIENTLSEQKNPANLPIRIIHAQLVRRDQLERLGKLPVVLDVQPVFLCTDLHWIESRLGKERLRAAYPWKTLTEAGLILAGGSDCPVESFDPVKGIYAAVMRQDLNGFPAGGWQPEERLSVFEAISLFTKNIAYTTGDEDVLGTIEAGKFADLTVLSEDPFRVKPDQLKNLIVDMTLVAGKIVYDRSTL